MTINKDIYYSRNSIIKMVETTCNIKSKCTHIHINCDFNVLNKLESKIEILSVKEYIPNVGVKLIYHYCSINMWILFFLFLFSEFIIMSFVYYYNKI